jgi:uncharacterized delta-60 repeat protein
MITVGILFALSLNSAAAYHAPDSLTIRPMARTLRHSPLPARLHALAIQPGTCSGRDPSRDRSPLTGTSAGGGTADPGHTINLWKSAQESVSVGWVQHVVSNTVPSADYPDAMAADSGGNVYITGSGDRSFSDGDIVTLKYSPKGILRWESRYTNPGTGYSEGFSVAVDSAKNVYVAGFRTDEFIGRILVTLKYDSLGNQLWVRTYGGGADSDNVAIGVAVDPGGRAYVLGYTEKKGESYDILLLAYSPAGDLRWSQRYDGDPHGIDLPSGIILNRTGNRITITGSSEGTGTGIDIMTMQYDDQGTELWRARFASSGNDEAVSLVTDGADTVTVGGTSDQTNHQNSYLLLRYSPTGGLLWSKMYNGLYAGEKRMVGLALNGANDIIVTGVLTPGSNPDFLTVRFDHLSGNILWEKKYDNATHGNDYPVGLVISTEGDLYVTGISRYGLQDPYSFLTIKYDSAGREVFVSRYNISGNDVFTSNILRDNAGNVFICGAAVGHNYDFLVLKYRSKQRGDWNALRYEGTNTAVPGTFLTDLSGNSYYSGWDGSALVFGKNDITSHSVWTNAIAGLIDARTVGSVLDPEGNLCLTGSARNSRGNLDILTAKISPSGSLLWIRSFDGPDGNDDFGVALASDSLGNILVTGMSHGTQTLDDIVVLRYRPDGTLEWVSRYNFPFDHDEDPAGIAVDHAGNAYVVGSVVRPNSSYDIAIIKFDTLGVQQWLRLYNGPGTGADQAVAIVLDRHDTIYAVGKSYGGATSTDIVLLKYDPAGNRQWVSRYTGSGPYPEEPTAMSIDGTGSPVVVGIAYHQSSSFDCLTIKFDPTGVILWQTEYDGPSHGGDYASGVAIDPRGSIYVCGTSLGSGSGNDIVTIRYTSDGWLDWVQRYNGVSNLDDQAVGVMTDTVGNVYVGGSSGNDSGGVNFVFMKYSSPLIESWPVEYNGPGTSADVAIALAACPQNNVVVVGQTEGQFVNLAYATTMYDPNGAELWRTNYNGAGSPVNIPKALVIDSSGAPIVTGLTQQGSSTFDFGTVRYSQTGIPQWSQIYFGSNNGYSFPSALALDRQQSVYVGGYSLINASQYDYGLVKYSSDGLLQWKTSYNDALNGNDILTAMVVDARSNVYVTGLSYGGGKPLDWETVRYDSSGSFRWAAVYDGPDHLDDRPIAMALDSLGFIYITGWSTGSLSEHDIVVVKYDTAGVPLWSARYDGPQNDRDEPVAIAVDRNGYIDVGGTSYNTAYTTPEYVLLQYSPAGALRWTRRFATAPRTNNTLAAMAVDSAGNCYLTGSSSDSISNPDAVTLKYDGDGNLLWSSRYHENSSIATKPVGLCLDHARNLYVAATSAGKNWSVMTTIKYMQQGTDAVRNETALPASFDLGQNYPNPFNPSTTIGYQLPVRSVVHLDLYNILGQHIRTLVDHEQSAGSYRVPFVADNLASGVYLVRMTAVASEFRAGTRSSFTSSKKMIFLK